MRIIDNCRSCDGEDFTMVYDLGDQYLSDFRDDSSKPPTYPLVLLYCNSCSLVQLAHTVGRELLYTENYGFRSGINPGIVADLKEIVELGLEYHSCGRWLDIGCNDGTLLSHVPESFWRIGVDPVGKFFEESKFHAREIVTDFFDPDAFDEGFEVITSISMFYDVDDLNTFVAGVARILPQRGVWIIQQNYLVDMIEMGAIDNICHEHLTYFSLGSLQPLLDRYGLEVISASRSPVNGGVLRTVVAWRGAHTRESSVDEIRLREINMGLDRPVTYLNFASRASANLANLCKLLLGLKSRDRVFIYGASTRGAVLWQAAGVDNQLVDFAVERQPEKIGKWYSPIGVRIISEHQMRTLQPDYLLVGPWWHRQMFVQREAEFLRHGGKMIFPLPKLEIVWDPGIPGGELASTDPVSRR